MDQCCRHPGLWISTATPSWERAWEATKPFKSATLKPHDTKAAQGRRQAKFEPSLMWSSSSVSLYSPVMAWAVADAD